MEIFLMGVLCCQFSHYLGWYKDDKTFLKFAVAGLALLTLLKSIQSLYVQPLNSADEISTYNLPLYLALSFGSSSLNTSTI